MNDLEKYFYSNKGKLIHKWLHYFEIYDRHFSKFRKKEIKILEFGVSHGGSLQMWKKYFGRRAKIYGVDINPECKKLEEKNVKIYILDQEDRSQLKKLMKEIGEVDIIIEDGGHQMKQQINTFEETFHYVKNGGVFLIEDLHTSYWSRYNAGLNMPGTFIEYAKKIIDDLNAWHTEDGSVLKPNQNTKTITGMHVYDSIIVFDKGKVIKPSHKMTGVRTIEDK